MKKNNILVGIDPSWRSFGMSLLDVENKSIHLYAKEFEYNKKEPYNVYYYTKPILKFITDIITKYHKDKITIGLEYHSTYGAYMQGEMLVLDNLIMTDIKNTSFKFSIEININMYFQDYIRHITKHKSSDKDFTITYVEHILEVLGDYGYKVVESVTTKSRKYGEHITDGEADSFIYLLRQMVLLVDDLPEDLQKFVKESLLDIQPDYSVNKELPWKY